jgi:hypothetical protein
MIFYLLPLFYYIVDTIFLIFDYLINLIKDFVEYDIDTIRDEYVSY